MSRSKPLLVVFTTVRLLKSPLNTKISKPRQNRCLRVIRFTRKRSNQRKITSKHRSYRLQSPVNRKFEASGEKNFVYWWILLAEIAFTGDSNWRQSRLAATSACRTPANGSTSVSGEKNILPLRRVGSAQVLNGDSLSTIICKFSKRSNFQ